MTALHCKSISNVLHYERACFFLLKPFFIFRHWQWPAYARAWLDTALLMLLQMRHIRRQSHTYIQSARAVSRRRRSAWPPPSTAYLGATHTHTTRFPAYFHGAMTDASRG